LHDVRRGYDIDALSDNPDTFSFPPNKTLDSNRCQGGATNSLVDGLYGIHPIYRKNVSTIDTLKSDLNKQYQQILASKINDIKTDDFEPQERESWFFSDTTPKSVKAIIVETFETEYKAKFIEDYGDYFTAAQINDSLEECSGKIPMPELLKKDLKFTVTKEMVVSALENKTLPFLIYDRAVGHVLALDYYLKKDVVNILKGLTSQPSLNCLLQIGRMNKGQMFTNWDLSELEFYIEQQAPDDNNLKILFIALSSHDNSARYGLIRSCFKHVHKQLSTYQLSDDQHELVNQMLHLAIKQNDVDVAKILLSQNFKDKITISNEVIILASEYGPLELLKQLLEHKNAETLDTDTAIKALAKAIKNSHIDIVKHLLTLPAIKAANAPIDIDIHPLVVAFYSKRSDILKEMIKDEEGRKLLFKYMSWQNSDGKQCESRAIEFAIASRNLEVLKIMLPHSTYRDKLLVLCHAKFGMSTIATCITISTCGLLYEGLSSEMFLKYASTTLEIRSEDLLIVSRAVLAWFVIVIPTECIIIERLDQHYHERYSISDVFLN